MSSCSASSFVTLTRLGLAPAWPGAESGQRANPHADHYFCWLHGPQGNTYSTGFDAVLPTSAAVATDGAASGRAPDGHFFRFLEGRKPIRRTLMPHGCRCIIVPTPVPMIYKKNVMFACG